MKENMKPRGLTGFFIIFFPAFVIASSVIASRVVALAGEGEDRNHESACKKLPNDVPDLLKAPAGQCLKESFSGVGVQVYVCTAGAWVFKAPEANLNTNGHFAGNHFLGPTWQLRDGSKVKTAPNPLKFPSPNSTNDIPWLLLTVASEEGSGHLDDVTFVQRLHTFGGAVPAGACSPDATEVRVPYTADYLFYHPKR